MPTRYGYLTVDVFTERAFSGNPVAVILDAKGLSTDEMHRVAAEFNYSESTFVLPPDDPSHTARVRIFTPKDEIPFAGHPNVGTASRSRTLPSGTGRRSGRPCSSKKAPASSPWNCCVTALDALRAPC